MIRTYRNTQDKNYDQLHQDFPKVIASANMSDSIFRTLALHKAEQKGNEEIGLFDK